MSWVAVVLLACALLVLVGAEWPRLDRRFGLEGRRRRDRDRRKSRLKVMSSSDSDDFAASVERDLANLPTIEREERR